MQKANLFVRSNLILSLITGVGLLTFFVLQQVVGNAVAQTQPVPSSNGTVITNTVWTAEGSPYLITEPVTIMPGVVLTIEAGVTVLGAVIDFPQFTVAETAHLRVQGTAESPVTFTSQANSGPGDWSGVAAFGSVHVEHALFQNSLFNVTISGESGGPIILANTVFSQSVYGPSVAINALHRLQMTDVAFVDVVNNRVLIDSIDYYDDLISDNVTLTAHPGLEGYEWGPNKVLGIPAGITLTLEPGVTLVGPEQGIVWLNGGHLQAVGTAESPVTFTSASGSIGGWDGISVLSGTVQLEQTVLEKGLYNLGIGPTAGPVTLQQSQSAHSTFAPLLVDVAALPNLQMEGVHFHNNAVNRIMLDTDSASALTDNATLTAQPGLEGYEVWHGGLEPYDLVVPDGITLTAESGVTLFVPDGNQIQVQGHLQASGTLTDPVSFTSVLTDTAGWDGIYLQGTAVLSHTLITQSQASGILVDGGDLTAVCSTFNHNQVAGIWITDQGLPQVTITASNLYDNQQAGLNNENSSQAEARFNWWGDANGPGGDGPGSGDAVWGEVLYEPWLTETAVCPLPVEPAQPELLVELTAVPQLGQPGQMITFTLVLTNSGDVSLNDLSSTVTVGPGFTLPDSLVPGVSFTASYTYTVLIDDLPGPLVNQVSVTAVPADHEPIVIETAVTVALYQPDFHLYLPLLRTTK